MGAKRDIWVWVIVGALLLLPALSLGSRLSPYLFGEGISWSRLAIAVLGLAVLYFWIFVIPKLANRRRARAEERRDE